jgi:hypothetical protein
MNGFPFLLQRARILMQAMFYHGEARGITKEIPETCVFVTLDRRKKLDQGLSFAPWQLNNRDA